MCRSMVDIQSPTAEITRRIKKKDKKKPQGKNIMSASATQGGHKNYGHCGNHFAFNFNFHACGFVLADIDSSNKRASSGRVQSFSSIL